MAITFSVVTPTFNSERYVEEAIESVILQRGNFYIDYVLIDNCSTDNTLTLIKRYQDDIEANNICCNCLGVKFRYVSESDSGMYEALSKGLKMCQGDYISYINSDDFYLPNAFHTVAKVFENEKIRWLTGVPSLYNEDGAIITAKTPCVFRSSYIRSGVYGRYLPHIQQESTFWVRKLSGAVDHDELSSLKHAGDYYMWSCFADNNELRTVNAQLSGFRQHSANKSLDVKAYNDEFESIAVNRLTILDYPKILIYKILFKLLGNNLLKYFPYVINVH